MVERLFKEIMAENSPNLGKDLDIQVLKANRSPPKFQSKTVFSKTHYNKTKSKLKREFFKQQGEKIFSYTREPPPHKGITIFFSKNLVSLEIKWYGVGWEMGGGIGMGNTWKSMADSCQCMAKTTTIL